MVSSVTPLLPSHRGAKPPSGKCFAAAGDLAGRVPHLLGLICIRHKMGFILEAKNAESQMNVRL